MAETERDKALDTALGQIEKQFGKGSVMRMGENLDMDIESIPTGALSLDLALGHRRAAPGPHRGDLRARVLGQVDPGHARRWPRPSATAASAPTSTPSTPWTRSTPGPSGSTSTTC